jgi:NAD(P)-dependent dehydrogenase (short-subunit alcohol dehydrogenase family)
MAGHFKQRAVALAGLAGLTAGALWIYQRQRAARMSFEDKVVVITGGSRGLGLEMARIWASEGARVAICSRDENELYAAARQLALRGHDILPVKCDVMERDQVEGFISQVVDEWGRVDVLVNNAGIIQTGPLECMTFDDFERSLATHFWGPLYLVHACLPHMRGETGARIVNIASIGGEISVPHMLPYSASKFALVGFSEGLASELRAAGIRVTTVCPGLMRTGSPRNAEFKGQHRAEYAWFSISGSLPLLSINAQVAARRIVEACRRGSPFLRFTLAAKTAVPLRNLFPGLTGHVLSFVNRMLPRAAGGTTESKRGYESFSAWSPSILTYLNEQAAARNNEV